MKVLYIGAGFVGTCSAAVSADSGHNVLVYDIDATRIKKLNSGNHEEIESCLFEDGLADLLIRHKERIRFTIDYAEVTRYLDDCDAVFMCIQTPEIGETGESNLTYYNAAAEQLAKALAGRNAGNQSKYIVIVNKSTVPIDMVDQTATIMDGHKVINYGVVSNPEFLVEGKAIQGSMRPDRVVVGAWNEKDFEVMRMVYQRFYVAPTVEYIEVNPREAAAGKLLANFYLFAKLALCFDVIGRTSEAFSDVGFENVRKILISESRIGNWGFYDSLYAGGSCFIKDARSLAHQLTTAGQDASLVEEVYFANKRQLQTFIKRAEDEAGIDWEGATVALLGVAFKRSTNDIRNSPSIDIAKHLISNRVGRINVFDPQATAMFQTLFPESEQIRYCSTMQDAISDADVIIVASDWPEFSQVADLIDASKKRVILDGRRMLYQKYAGLVAQGHTVLAVGSPAMLP